jgi:replicative DNA helicase Mcm
MHGRFDKYQPISEQFEFRSALLSRFDLIYTVADQPDYDDDKQLADHVLENHDLEKQKAANDTELTDEELAAVAGPLSDNILTKWLALARDQPAPPFASEDLREDLAERYAKFRVSNTSEDSPIPIAARKLKAITRIAEAAAKLEFCDVIEQRHVDIALEQTKESLKDVGMNEDGQFDADVVETGTSTPQRSRIKSLAELIETMCDEEGGPVDTTELLDRAVDDLNLERGKAEDTLNKLRLKKGWVYEPQAGKTKWVGRD